MTSAFCSISFSSALTSLSRDTLTSESFTQFTLARCVDSYFEVRHHRHHLLFGEFERLAEDLLPGCKGAGVGGRVLLHVVLVHFFESHFRLTPITLGKGFGLPARLLL